MTAWSLLVVEEQLSPQEYGGKAAAVLDAEPASAALTLNLSRQNITERGGFMSNFEVMQWIQHRSDERDVDIAILRDEKAVRLSREKKTAGPVEIEDESITRLNPSLLATLSHQVGRFTPYRPQVCADSEDESSASHFNSCPCRSTP